MMQKKDLLKQSLIGQIRRNHALEHATLHILSKKKMTGFFGGFSDSSGVRILGDFSTEELQAALDEALARLNGGEKRLAIHPNCGTNFVTAGFFAGFAAWLALLGTQKNLKSRLGRLPLVVALATLALIFSRPVGPYLQQLVTTDANPGTLQVVEIRRHDFGQLIVHRIRTRY